jgi:hypothetical protein
MARATRLPEIEIREQTVGFELAAPAEALLQLADAFSGEVRSIEVTPDDGSTLVVGVTTGPVTLSHEGPRVEISGGRNELDGFAAYLRSVVATRPARPRSIRYHAHLEYYPEHPWLSANSVPVVVTLTDS